MKKIKKIGKLCLPVAIYIVCSLFALLFWQLFKFNLIPVAVSSIIFLVAGGFLSGFFSKGKIGKNGMQLTIAAIVLSNILMFIGFTTKNSVVAYIATAISSYLFNIQTCFSFGTPDYIVYIGFAISVIAPIALVLLGKHFGNKTKKKPKKKK